VTVPSDIAKVAAPEICAALHLKHRA